METVVDLDGFDALVDHIAGLLAPWGVPVSADKVHAERYGDGVDERIGWKTWLVTLDGYGVVGFTDGEPKR